MPAGSKISSPWRIADSARLRWRFWDGEGAVYDDLSGDTHYLPPLAAIVFERLLAGPADEAALAAAIRDALGLAPDEDPTSALAETLDRLYSTRMIEPTQP